MLHLFPTGISFCMVRHFGHERHGWLMCPHQNWIGMAKAMEDFIASFQGN